MRDSGAIAAPEASRAARFALWLLLLTAFLGYRAFASRFVGGCDTWAYLSDSFALRGRDIGLSGSLDPARFPALVPLCYDLIDHHVVSLMPPGFPVLLALAGLFHAEFWTSPLLGALGVALLYETLRRRSGPWIALALAATWATSPIVVWGSTQLMSDMAAATLALLSFVLVERSRESAAGAALGFSFYIRPTNVLALPALLVAAVQSGRARKFGAGLAISILAGSAFALGRYATLFPPGYSNNLHEFSPAHVFHQLGFFARTTFAMFWPVVLLALFEIYRRPRRSAGMLLWILPYVALYALWKSPFVDWWWSRYLLPAYPPLFILGAEGAVTAANYVRDAGLSLTALRALGAMVTLAICGRALTFDQNHHLFVRDFEEGYAVDSRRVAELVPPNGLIAAVNFTGPLRMYAGLESFKYDHPRALELVAWALDAERPVYAVIEPNELDENPRIRALRARFDLEDVAPLSTWPGLMLKRVVSRGGMRRLDLVLGTPAARRFLGSGWSGDEFDEHERWVWAVGPRSTLDVPLESGRDVLMTLALAPFVVPDRKQTVDVVVNDEKVATLDLAPDLETRSVELPGRVVRDRNHVELRYGYSVSPKALGKSPDERELAVIVERISFERAKSGDR